MVLIPPQPSIVSQIINLHRDIGQRYAAYQAGNLMPAYLPPEFRQANIHVLYVQFLLKLLGYDTGSTPAAIHSALLGEAWSDAPFNSSLIGSFAFLSLTPSNPVLNNLCLLLLPTGQALTFMPNQGIREFNDPFISLALHINICVQGPSTAGPWYQSGVL